MVCYTETQQECDTAPPCAGGDCPQTDTGSCHDVTQSGCVPQYFLPCEADADCGAGFTCVAEEDCSCAGSAPSSGGSSGSAGSSGANDPTPPAEKPAPDADAGAGDPAPDPGATPDGGTSEPPPDCVCTKTDRKSCSLKVVVCSVDEGCPAGWTCGDNPNRVCAVSSDGTSACSDVPEKICLPPYSDLLKQGNAVDDTGGTPLGAPDVPKGSGDPSGTPEAGTGGSSSSGSHAASEDASESEDSGGCAIGRAPSTAAATFGFAALALAGLFGARRRRRAR
jgi:hypothetical protein